jgi:HD superfamily phosphohydrolase YqeK
VLLERIAVLDRVLEEHAEELGEDLAGYRNHAYRVVNLCMALGPAGEMALEKVAIAAAFHDLGIWSARTFDYLQPSMQLACTHLACAGHSGWHGDIAA